MQSLCPENLDIETQKKVKTLMRKIKRVSQNPTEHLRVFNNTVRTSMCGDCFGPSNPQEPRPGCSSC